MPSKVDTDAIYYSMGRDKNVQESVATNANVDRTDATMGINNNVQEPGETNYNEVQDD